MTLPLNHILSFGSPMRYNNLRLHFWRGDYCLRNQPYAVGAYTTHKNPKGRWCEGGEGVKKEENMALSQIQQIFKAIRSFQNILYSLYMFKNIFLCTNFGKLANFLADFTLPYLYDDGFYATQRETEEAKGGKERGRNSSFWSSLFLASTNGLFYSFISWKIRPYVKGK